MSLPAFISLDGIDGTGKTTQCQLLKEWLEQASVPFTHCVDPGGTDLGAKLRQILLDNKSTLSFRSEALLFMASRAQLVEEKIKPALKAGQIVLTDRYLLANLVYQGHAGGLPLSELKNIGQFCTEGILPGRVFILDMPIEEAITRRGRSADRMEARSLEYQQKVREGFLKEAALEPDKYFVVDARSDVASIQKKIRSETLKFLHSLHLPGLEKLIP
ncbi:dTMP kinase [Telmatocola sphagniphila]|uniref:Thymidylate kinase n=1 Tax=Telmatocola sphagniphila TaxID=1123043 RepID=A0A8E6BCK6_9BACT|nr:dTMP kinase [Telmatocola sphagniphila]QVL34415.1 dTMP kinase [Telmatocola sphagniphila]